MPKDENTYVEICMGTDEDFFSHICVNLVVGGLIFLIWQSDSLNDASGEDFLSFLEIASNPAILMRNKLHIPLLLDEELFTESSEFSIEDGLKIRKFLKEIQ